MSDDIKGLLVLVAAEGPLSEEELAALEVLLERFGMSDLSESWKP